MGAPDLPGGGPAFPNGAVKTPVDVDGEERIGEVLHQPGLTQRAYIATAAMQALLTSADGPSRQEGETYSQATARVAVAYADALLAELAKPREGR